MGSAACACVRGLVFAASVVAMAGGAARPARAGSDGWHPVVTIGELDLRDAMQAGVESGLPVYPCRAPIGGGIQLGRVRPDFKGCHIGYAGREVEIVAFDVLGATWRAAENATFPPSSLPAGEELHSDFSGLEGVVLYPCRAAYRGGIHIGQVMKGDTACHLGYGGVQVDVARFEVLQAEPWMTWVRRQPHDVARDAVASGSEGGELFYICRASDRTGLHPGKIKDAAPGCSIVSDGREIVASRFEVLVSRWVAAEDGHAPVAAIPSGQESTAVQFLCRGKDGDATEVGKVGATLGGCHIGAQGRELVVRSYEVLAR